MAGQQLPQTSLQVALRRLELCAYAVQEIHTEIDPPHDPEQKADLLIATEKLVGEIVDLYSTVRRYAWGEEEEEIEEREL